MTLKLTFVSVLFFLKYSVKLKLETLTYSSMSKNKSNWGARASHSMAWWIMWISEHPLQLGLGQMFLHNSLIIKHYGLPGCFGELKPISFLANNVSNSWFQHLMTLILTDINTPLALGRKNRRNRQMSLYSVNYSSAFIDQLVHKIMKQPTQLVLMQQNIQLIIKECTKDPYIPLFLFHLVRVLTSVLNWGG